MSLCYEYQQKSPNEVVDERLRGGVWVNLIDSSKSEENEMFECENEGIIDGVVVVVDVREGWDEKGKRRVEEYL